MREHHMLRQGLYEQVINKTLRAELDSSMDTRQDTASIDQAEASKVLAQYITEIIEKGLDNVIDNGGDLQSQVSLANKIVQTILTQTGENTFEGMSVDESAEQLLAFFNRKNTIHAVDDKAKIIRPETSIAQSSLFTGAVHEPQMYTELKKEIASCDRIDMLVSFIKWSGLRLIIDELREFTDNKGILRIITTSYMGATDIKAIEELQKLQNTEIKVSYDTKRTRLHAKTYVFYRNTGFTTAYVGSSNMSNAAMSTGLEWNVKVTKKDLPDTIKKIDATFESYWNSSDFEVYSSEQKARLAKALKAERRNDTDGLMPFAFDIKPYPFQEEILEQLQAERQIRDQFRNLVVAATGTGKTVISAFDYKRYCKQIGRQARLLFIVHREEILKQSLACFRGILKDPNFGELFVGGYRPSRLDHLFCSIQTFGSQNMPSKTSANFYDYIIVDEFHHAAAESYQELLEYYMPEVLLGLTATPERMDKKSILGYFNNRIAAEIRLPEAINRKLLSPFQYFGISDTVDLSTLTWSRGGYDKRELSNIYALDSFAAKQRADMIIGAIIKYVTDLHEVKGLGFCVTQEHANFMTVYFNDHGIRSLCLISESPDSERFTAKQRLVSGEIQFIFVVDIYNEGIDIPEVNTVLFLRPTESLTVFLQQLGRGLRLAENKECLTVLDFIGQANKRYNFEDKFAALLSNSTKSVQREIKDGFNSLPKGCYIQLERKAQDHILENIRLSFDFKAGLKSRIETFEEDSEQGLNLENFLNYYHLDIRQVYSRYSFARLCVEAGEKDEFNEPMEEELTRAFSRVCAIDSRRWILFLLNILPKLNTIDLSALEEIEISMLRMFQFTVWPLTSSDVDLKKLKDELLKLNQSPVMFDELIEILQYNYNYLDFIDESVDVGFDCPLDLHCQYTRDQIFVALGKLNPGTVRQGVMWLEDKKLDVFINTLNKAEKDYSPSTMYNDYSINKWLFHWQSQSTTSEDSPTGKRYINHLNLRSKVLLFVREFKKDIAGTAPFTFLGLADYMQHEGSKPMNIVWKLHKPIPARFIKKTNKLT